MIIDVTPDVRISVEHLNVVLEKKRVVQEGPNKGTMAWDAFGYHGNLRTAAQSLLKHHFHLIAKSFQSETKVNLATLISAVDQGADLIARACEEQK